MRIDVEERRIVVEDGSRVLVLDLETGELTLYEERSGELVELFKTAIPWWSR